MKKIVSLVLTMIIVLSLTITFVSCSDSKDDYFVTPTGKYFDDDNLVFASGYGTDNNGKEKNTPEMDRLTSVVPSDRQLDFLELEYYSFIHFGMNTFTGKEWGTGREKPSQFKLKEANTDQWCKAIKDSGSKGVIFTAKHHDGFCLWPTKTSVHSIEYSPYKNGKGDLVKEMAKSCKDAGLKFGLYISPWDMNQAVYGCNRYNSLLKRQVRELLSGDYGEIFTVWFDGARGKNQTLNDNFEYDWEGLEELIHALQPNCVVSNQGSEVRWVGNEAGVSRENEWSVISEGSDSTQKHQDTAGGGAKLQSVKYDSSDVGSRELLSNYKNLVFKPSEADVSLHKGWFYHSTQKPKDLDHLIKIYNKSVGGNTSLLLNVCPNKDGIIVEKDVKRLKEFGDSIKAMYENPIAIKTVKVGNITQMKELSSDKKQDIISEERYTNYEFNETDYIVDLTFLNPSKVTRIDLREDLRYSHRVEYFDTYLRVNGKWELLSNSGNIGNRRSIIIKPGTEKVCDGVRIVIKQARKAPILRSICIYA